MRSVFVPLLLLGLAASGFAQDELLPAHTTTAVDENLNTNVFLPRRELTVGEVIDLVKVHARVEVVVDPEVKLGKHVRLGSGQVTGWEAIQRMDRLRGVGGDSFYGVLYVTCHNTPMYSPSCGPLQPEDAAVRLALSFDATPVAGAIATIASLTGIPFEIAEPSSRTVTLALRRRPLAEALPIFCRVARLTLERKGKRYVFSAWKSDDAITFDVKNRRAWTNYFLDECRISRGARAATASEVVGFMMDQILETARDSDGRPAVVHTVWEEGVDASRLVLVTGTDMRVRDALSEVVSQLGAAYDVQGNTVFIHPRAE